MKVGVVGASGIRRRRTAAALVAHPKIGAEYGDKGKKEGRRICPPCSPKL